MGGIPSAAMQQCFLDYTTDEISLWDAGDNVDTSDMQYLINTMLNANPDSVLICGAASGSAISEAASYLSVGASPCPPMYYMCDPRIKAYIDPEVYEEQISMMEMVAEVEECVAACDAYNATYVDPDDLIFK